jgi:hypothetical protein
MLVFKLISVNYCETKHAVTSTAKQSEDLENKQPNSKYVGNFKVYIKETRVGWF